MNPVHAFRHFFPKIHSNIIFLPSPRSSELSLPFRFPNLNIVRIYLPHPCYMPRSSHPANNTWRSVQVMKLLIMQPSPVSRHFHLGSNILLLVCSSFIERDQVSHPYKSRSVWRKDRKKWAKQTNKLINPIFRVLSRYNIRILSFLSWAW